MTPKEFFIKYPSINEYWKSADEKLHFNEGDADLHSRMNSLAGKPVKVTREVEAKSTKTS
jgi:hypothetical protein